jgi:hypothetical protein
MAYNRETEEEQEALKIEKKEKKDWVTEITEELESSVRTPAAPGELGFGEIYQD